MASIYKKGNVYWVCYMEGGQKFDKSLKTKDKKTAQVRKSQIEVRIAHGEEALPDRSLSAKDAYEGFKTSREGRLSPETIKTDNFRIDRFLKEASIGKLTQITEQTLKSHLDHRIKVDKIDPRTANHTIRVMKTFLNWAVKTKLIAKNQLAYMQRYKMNTLEPRFLSHDEVKKLLDASLRSKQAGIIIATAIYTGARRGELERMQWSDLDFKEKTISIPLSKSGKFRKIPLHNDLATILLPFKAEGPCFKMRGFRVLWDDLKDSLEIDLRFHDLRHTHASLLIKSGVDIYTVSKLLGHSQVSTTQIYAHLYQDHVQDAVNKLKI